LGSLHGYDVTEPLRLNPELGSEEEFEALVQKLNSYGMGLLLDIVPNHMAVSPENLWWMDFLENGLYSPYAAFFDIDWSMAKTETENKVILPILNSPYTQALEGQEIALTLEESGLCFSYNNYRLPLDVKSYCLVISHRLNTLKVALGDGHPGFQQLGQIMDVLDHLPSITSPELGNISEPYRERQAIKKAFLRLVNTSPEIKTFLLATIALFNGKKGDPRSFEPLNQLLEQQAYRLSFWKTAREQINYRRFFDINDLIGIRVEELEVFETTHALILQLIQGGKVSGLRIDHVDGLYDPLQYLSRLQHHISPQAEQTGKLPSFYIIVEKILSEKEVLAEEWPVFGTTGYDFLNMVNAIFVDSKGVQRMGETYSRLTGAPAVFADIVYKRKRQVIEELFPSEVHALGHYLAQLAQQSWPDFNSSSKELTKAIIEITACLPIYRTYIRTLEVSPRDQLHLERVIQEAQRRNPALETGALDFLKRVLFLEFPSSLTPKREEAWLHFVLRWQQLTAAIMAKGFEDTALYDYNRLVSLNEVGGDPGCVGLSVDEFHHRNLARLAQWPYSLNTTSTHDTKRSEDVRARINVLSEIPGDWERYLIQWSRWNRPRKIIVNGLLVPEPNMEILLYQTLLGAWPLYEEEIPEFKERLKTHIVKAAREAKAFTSWLSPNLEYENAVIAFLESILEVYEQNEFLRALLQFQRQIAYYGALNSLAQVLLKITSPGVPDFYQGTELWDFSLVDPDNRRSVDFNRSLKILNDLVQQEAQEKSSLVRELLASWEDGRVKLYVTYKALNLRGTYRDLFRDGDYIPLQLWGQRREHVCTFARRLGKTWAVVAVPKFLTKLVSPGSFPLGQQVWQDDALVLPKEAPEEWLNVFTGETLTVPAATKTAALSSVFSVFPITLLVNVRC
jgi:(1->4)-alpha-D-glucan 1-alpha-D-glucosylmutase